MFDWLYDLDLTILDPAIIILITGTAEVGARLGQRFRRRAPYEADIGTLTGALLGLLALLLGFSFSLAVSRYDESRNLVLEEANAIGSTANFALMLPAPTQGPILRLLHDYAVVRIGLAVPFDRAQLERDIARSLDLQNRLWQQATIVTAAAPQSLPAYRFVASLNEVNNIHEKQLTALRYHVPGALMFMLVGIAMVAMGFTSFERGITGARRPVAILIMSLTVAMVIILVADLDRPSRGVIRVPVQALVDAAHGIPAQ
jgi:hypothetical protein